MALGLGYVNGPELGGSLVIFFGVMMAVAAVDEDNRAPREAFITLYCRGGDRYLRRILFRGALKCGDSSIGVEWVSARRTGSWWPSVLRLNVGDGICCFCHYEDLQ